MGNSNSDNANDSMKRNSVVLVPIDPEKLGIKEQPFTNVPLINHLQECAESYRLIKDEEFCLKCKQNRIGEPITALNFDWYGRTSELLTILLQRAVLGSESFISGIVLHEIVQRGLVTENTREHILNPFSLGRGGTAENYFNNLPALVDPSYSLNKSDPVLWSEIHPFYKETRNKIFHGYQLNGNDPSVIQPYFELIRRLFMWMDSWFEDRMSTIMPIQIKRYWPEIDISEKRPHA